MFLPVPGMIVSTDDMHLGNLTRPMFDINQPLTRIYYSILHAH